MKMTHNSKNTIYAFDLHEVVVKPDYLQLFLYGLRHLPKIWLILYSFWPPFLFKLLKARRETKVPEVMFNIMSNAYPRIEPIWKHFIIMSNMQQLNLPVVQIIKELKQHNFAIYLFSNIGPETLKDLRTKLPLDSLFDGFFCPQKEDDFLHKPNPKFYESFINYIYIRHPDNPSIIFIDDKSKNIEVARKVGLIATRYSDSTQLRKILNEQ